MDILKSIFAIETLDKQSSKIISTVEVDNV